MNFLHTLQAIGEKRAAPDSGKKPKTPKKKKKKDPNEPQKPVSAYALFFRDTQAAIKGQNPNATFGEVSKIVASMWDSLGEEQKQVRPRPISATSCYKATSVFLTPFPSEYIRCIGPLLMQAFLSCGIKTHTHPPIKAKPLSDSMDFSVPLRVHVHNPFGGELEGIQVVSSKR